MSQRLYLPPELLEARVDDVITLDRSRSHYLCNVLRLKEGTRLECFDGAGRAWSARLEGGKRALTLVLEALSREEPAAATALELAIGWLKGAAMDVVLQKATELNASAIIILRTDRSNVSLKGERLAGKRGHWEGVLVSAAEQCGRLHLPALEGPLTLDALLERDGTTERLLLDPGAPPLNAGPEPRGLTLLVGPEGGWSERERALAQARGVSRAGLGTSVLRAETAPLAALAAVRHGWGWRR